MLRRPAPTAIQPSQLKCSRCPFACFDTSQPPKVELIPDARSRAQLDRLRKAPRRDDGTARVRIACPGTKRPLANMKKNPASTNVAQTGNGPEFAIVRMTIEAPTTR